MKPLDLRPGHTISCYVFLDLSQSDIEIQLKKIKMKLKFNFFSLNFCSSLTINLIILIPDIHFCKPKVYEFEISPISSFVTLILTIKEMEKVLGLNCGCDVVGTVSIFYHHSMDAQ